jgi:hypothetical protein
MTGPFWNDLAIATLTASHFRAKTNRTSSPACATLHAPKSQKAMGMTFAGRVLS